MHHADVVRQGDGERVRRLHAARDAIADLPSVSPVLELAAAAGSSAVRAKFGRPARVRISRGAIDASWWALLGELAHELAHLVDPHERRDRALAASAGIPLVLWLGALVVVSNPWHESSATAAFAVWIAGWPVVAMSGWWFARVNGQVELHADRMAAKLLGSAEPVRAMVNRFDALDSQRSRSHRFFARLTHPSPTRRRLALQDPEGAQSRHT
jgi:Zn-dependent protease with chaperone function